MSKGQTRSFKMHPDLLWSVIKSQAGSLQKAILESVMNSIDAGATAVYVLLDQKQYEVRDDGKGFTGRQEIESFFETFGTPHQEGDARYGRFRMGRGQGFAFSVNTWRTGEFEMHVDIKNLGLDYQLKEGLDPVKGCHIVGQLYDRLSPSELLACQRALQEQCRYTPTPVYLNGEQVNLDVDTVKWDLETEEAYFKLDNTNSLSLYNLGVLVCNYNAHEMGIGGVVVSKKQLELNFARNDVLRAQCQVWKQIKQVLSREADKRNDARDKRTRITEEWRCFKAQEMLVLGELISEGETEVMINAPVFTDVAGKHYSLKRLANVKCLAVGARGDLMSDRIQQAGVAVVLSGEALRNRFGIPMKQVLEKLSNVRRSSSWDPDGKRYDFGSIGYLARDASKLLVDIDELAKGFDSKHEVLEAKSLKPEARLALRVIGQNQDGIRWALNRVLSEPTQALRQIHAMRSETADAFTDGVHHIYIERRFLSGHGGPGNGISWAYQIVALLVHEYLHNFASGIGHEHDGEFFEAFHDVMSSPEIGDAINSLFREWVKASTHELKKLSQKLGRQADAADQHDRNLAAVAA